MTITNQRADKERVSEAKWALAEALDALRDEIKGKDAGWQCVQLVGLPNLSLEYLVESFAYWLEANLGD